MLKRFGDNQEASASNSELAPTRLGMTIEEQWPALKLVGFGFYYAWIWVSYNSNVLVFPSVASDLPPDTISLTYLVSTLALGVALVLLSLVRPLTRRLVGSNLLLIAVAVVVGAATVGAYASSSLGRRCEPLPYRERCTDRRGHVGHRAEVRRRLLEGAGARGCHVHGGVLRVRRHDLLHGRGAA